MQMSNVIIEELNKKIAVERAVFIASLPVASPDMVAELCANATAFQSGKCEWLDKTHRLDADGEDRLSIAKAEHRIRCNTSEVRAEVTDLVCKATRLHSFKYSITPKGVKFKVSGIASRMPRY